MQYEGFSLPAKSPSPQPVQPRSFCLVSLPFFSSPESFLPGFISKYKPVNKANENLFSCTKGYWQSTPLTHHSQTLLHCSMSVSQLLHQNSSWAALDPRICCSIPGTILLVMGQNHAWEHANKPH